VKKILRSIKACALYFIFVFFVVVFATALSERGTQVRFRNGEPMSEGQRIIAVFVFFLLVIVSGYGAFKRAQLDWKLWKRKHREYPSAKKKY